MQNWKTNRDMCKQVSWVMKAQQSIADLYSAQLLAESTQVGFSQSGVNSAHDSSRYSNVDSNHLKTQAVFNVMTPTQL